MNCQYNGCGDEGVLRDGGVFLCDYHDHGHLGPDYSEGWAHGREEVASLKAQLAAVEKERDEARAMAYVPGLRECAKCGCTLVTTTIHVPSGNLSVDRKPKDCPNGCGPTWPVTERQAANAAIKREDAALLRANELAPRVAVAEAERDEAIDKAIDYMAACTKAETERDAATGALAAAQAALKRWRDEYEHAEDCEWMDIRRRRRQGRALAAGRRGVPVLPAADLAARHDAEVERRALEAASACIMGVSSMTRRRARRGRQYPIAR
jgi:uncharacterized protein YhaN